MIERNSLYNIWLAFIKMFQKYFVNHFKLLKLCTLKIKLFAEKCLIELVLRDSSGKDISLENVRI